jgi:hypothetical protein
VASGEEKGAGVCLLTGYSCSIESMKMETVIRSPQKGVVKKLAHKEGVSLSPWWTRDGTLTEATGYLQGWDGAGAV